MATDPDGLEVRARRLREQAREQRAEQRRSLFDGDLTKSQQRLKNERNRERRERREQEARAREVAEIRHRLQDATDGELRAALTDDEAFDRMTDAETIEANFGGRLLDHDDVRERAREVIQRELEIRRRNQEGRARPDGGTIPANAAAGVAVDDRVLIAIGLGALYVFAKR